MSLLTLEEAADRLGVSRQTIEAWVGQGLLTACPGPDAPNLPPRVGEVAPGVCYIDEDRLRDLAESLGWLQLSSENWDGDEEE